MLATRGPCSLRSARLVVDDLREWQDKLVDGGTGEPHAVCDGGDAWAKQWGNVYGTNPANQTSRLAGVPFLSVMGNHDLGNTDPCALPARAVTPPVASSDLPWLLTTASSIAGMLCARG